MFYSHKKHRHLDFLGDDDVATSINNSVVVFPSYPMLSDEEVDMICMYYGQIPENLPYNLKAILVEKFEKEFQPKIEKAYNEVIKYPN